MKQIEAVVAQASDLQDGQMQQVSVGETDVLLVRLKGDFHAVGAYCSHYQAPLAKGVLSQDRVVCPWHNACFNLATGDQQEPPGLDALERYPVRVEGNDVIVSVPEKAVGRRTPSMAQYNPKVDSRIFVILGAGAAGAHAAETLREARYQGRVVMVTQENRLPYDRTWLSKDYFIGKVAKQEVSLRTPEFYREHDIEVWLNKTATEVDAAVKTITFADGDRLNYDALLLATGGKPRQLKVEGSHLANIFTLRSFDDTERILANAQEGKKAVVVGSSFIGMESAAGLAQQGVSVRVVSPESLPFETILGKEIGQVFKTVHAENGVTFYPGQKVSKFEGKDTVEAAILDGGERLAADLVVVGIGVQPATEFLKGVELHQKDRSVLVNKYLQVADGLYAAGDIARYPELDSNQTTRIEHWRLAAQQGRIAAYNMVGKNIQFSSVPVFWTMQFKFPLRYVGHAEEWDEIIFDGAPQERQFIAYYVKGDRVVAVASSKRDTETAAIYELMRLNQMPTPQQLRDRDVTSIVEYLNACESR